MVISKEELIEEIKKAPDDKISITDALVDVSTSIRFRSLPLHFGVRMDD